MWICPECRQIYDTAVERCERDDAPVAEVFAHQTKARYPLLGRIVGDRYHLIGGLGQGGLGTVYLAQHRHLGQLFAVKFLELQSLGAGAEIDDQQKSGYRRDFLKEAQVASLVRHPSVVRVTDFGEHDGLPFLVMEYVPGPSLLQMLGARGRFPVAEAVSIGRRIAEALDAFHERRLVHRDLKPANVILDPRGDGRLTLVDLGLVKDLSNIGARASTHPLALRGTPGYLAPEQVPAWVLAQQGVKSANEKRVVDARVDLYALGVIFYEMLAGVSPYPDGSNTSVIVWACTRDPIPMASVEPPVRVPHPLESLVYATMSRDPERRPASAAEFLERLDEATIGHALQGSWPALIAPGLRREPERSAPPAVAPPSVPPSDQLARLSRLRPEQPSLDGEEALESTAVFSEDSIDSVVVPPPPVAAPAPAPSPLPGPSAGGQEPGGRAIESAGRQAGGVPSALPEPRRPTGPIASSLEIRRVALASPDRTMEAEVIDEPEDFDRSVSDLPPAGFASAGVGRLPLHGQVGELTQAEGTLPRASAATGEVGPPRAGPSAPPLDPGELAVETQERPVVGLPGSGGRAAPHDTESPEDADFELDLLTQVERVSPAQTAVQPLPGGRPLADRESPPSPLAVPDRGPIAVPDRAPIRPERRVRPSPAPRAPLWRVPVAVGLVAAAAATGWYFAQRADTPEYPEAQVIRIGGADAGVSAPRPLPSGIPPSRVTAGGPSAGPALPPSRPPTPVTAAPAPARPSAGSPPSAAAGGHEPGGRPAAGGQEPGGRAKRPSPAALDQLLVAGDAAYGARDFVGALTRYETFLDRADPSHAKYWLIHSRVEALREKVQSAPR